MNKLYPLIVCLFLISCNSEKKRVHPDPEPVPAIGTKQPENAGSDLPIDSIAFIRKKVERINTGKLKTKQFEFKCDELMKVDYFYRNDSIVKIVVDFGTIGDTYAREDYYYDRGELIFMYEFVEGGPACEGCITKHEYRYYIKDHKTFRSLKNKHEQPCRKCEFSTASRQYKLLKTKTVAEIKNTICK